MIGGIEDAGGSREGGRKPPDSAIAGLLLRRRLRLDLNYPVDQLGHRVIPVAAWPDRPQNVMQPLQAQPTVNLAQLSDVDDRLTLRMTINILVSPAPQAGKIWTRWIIE